MSYTHPDQFGFSFGFVLAVTPQMQEQRVKSAAVITDLKPPPAENVVGERVPVKSGSSKQMKSPITSTAYTVASLQSATNSFSQEFIIGEGSLGRVYKAEFPNGKVTSIVLHLFSAFLLLSFWQFVLVMYR